MKTDLKYTEQFGSLSHPNAEFVSEDFAHQCQRYFSSYLSLVMGRRYLMPQRATTTMILSHLTVAAEAEAGAVVLVIGESWGPGGSKAPALRSSGVDTAPLIASAPQIGDRNEWSTRSQCSSMRKQVSLGMERSATLCVPD
jgi:hypothetical protein